LQHIEGNVQLKTVNSTIKDIRSMICDKLIMALAWLSIPALISSLFRISVIGWKPVMLMHIILVGLLWLFFLGRSHFSYFKKAAFIIGVFLSIGLGGMLQFGLTTGVIVFTVTTPPLVVLFFSDKAAYAILIFVLISIAIIGVLTVAGYLAPGFNLDIFHSSASTWVAVLFGAFLVSGSLTVSMSIFNSNLISALEVSRTSEDELTRHKIELEKIVEEKTIELKQSNKAPEKFARLAAHDMVSPLNVISGNAQMLLM